MCHKLDTINETRNVLDSHIENQSSCVSVSSRDIRDAGFGYADDTCSLDLFVAGFGLTDFYWYCYKKIQNISSRILWF